MSIIFIHIETLNSLIHLCKCGNTMIIPHYHIYIDIDVDAEEGEDGSYACLMDKVFRCLSLL
jgi:hypothetical protein